MLREERGALGAQAALTLNRTGVSAADPLPMVKLAVEVGPTPPCPCTQPCPWSSLPSMWRQRVRAHTRSSSRQTPREDTAYRLRFFAKDNCDL